MDTKLDYKIQSPEERIKLVLNIIAETKPEKLTPTYLEKMSDYIVYSLTKEEKKQKYILTDNRKVTINKRETSMEDLKAKFEENEDGIYNLMIENDKNILLEPKISISIKDKAEVPGLKELIEVIRILEQQEKKAVGKKRYLLKKHIIELLQEQYVLKLSYKQPILPSNLIKSFARSDLTETITFDENDEPVSNGFVSFFNSNHLSALLCNYSALKEESYGNFVSDFYYAMEDLDKLIESVLKNDYPFLYKLLIYKIDGKTNLEIQSLLEAEFGISRSIEYISSLWRNKIPKLLAEGAKKQYLVWYYTYKEYGKWKRCSRCKEYKLAHNLFFSKNNTSKDHFYSICKDCRNKKGEKVIKYENVSKM